MDGSKKPSLPLARVRTVMRSDPDVHSVSQEAQVLMAAAAVTDNRCGLSQGIVFVQNGPCRNGGTGAREAKAKDNTTERHLFVIHTCVLTCSGRGECERAV